MASAGVGGGSEDVNDFLARVKELGQQRDREDEERSRRLEEDIMQGRQERAARRAERARSISPRKESPTSFASSAPRSIMATPLPAKPMMSSPPRKELSEAPSFSPSTFEPAKPAPPSPSSLSRSGTLSWQQRPLSRGSGTMGSVRSRPLSMVAASNAMRSPSATPEPSSKEETETHTREQSFSPDNSQIQSAEETLEPSVSSTSIAQKLAGKDPSWFRQTADRGQGNAALRKNQVEDSPHRGSPGVNVPLLGMSRESTAEPEATPSERPSSSHSRVSMQRGFDTSSVGTSSARIASPLPNLSSQRFDPPSTNTSVSSMEPPATRSYAMSPAQGRISPERPSSPTKGTGGFVQSAMLKRNDSVNKRWSAQATPGLSRGNSIIGGRNGHERGDSSSGSKTSPILPDVFEEKAKADDELDASEGVKSDPINTSELESTPSRPGSPSKRWSPAKSSWLESAINKPDSPKPKFATPSQPAWMADIAKAKQNRGSSDLGKSSSFPDVSVGGLLRSPPMNSPVKEITTPLGNAFASGSAAKKPSSERSPTRLGTAERAKAESGAATEQLNGRESMTVEEKIAEPAQGKHIDESFDKTEVFKDVPREPSSTPEIRTLPLKPKPETPPKKDLRGALRSRTQASDNDQKEEPEFRKAFGTLRKAQTKNYVAPDELKDNITRSKAGLSATGGPQQTKHVDEFKESILAKKKQWSAAPVGTPFRSATAKEEYTPPEALAKRSGMLAKTQSAPSPTPPNDSANSEARVSASKLALSTSPPIPEALAKRSGMPNKTPVQSSTMAASNINKPEPTLAKEAEPAIIAPKPSIVDGSLVGKAAGGKLTNRFNPNLAGLLARGPSPKVAGTVKSPPDTSIERPYSNAQSATEPSQGPELSHVTKGRARGPKRKPPTSINTPPSQAQEAEPESVKPIKRTEAPVNKPDITKSSPGHQPLPRTPASVPSKPDTLGIFQARATTFNATQGHKPSPAVIAVDANPAESKGPAPKLSAKPTSLGNNAVTDPISTSSERSLPLATITNNAIKQPLEKPSTPARKPSVATEMTVTPSKRASPTAADSSPIKAKRLSFGAKPPPEFAQPVGSRRTLATPPSPLPAPKSPRSPPMPSKSSRSISASLRSPLSPKPKPAKSSAPAPPAIIAFFGALPPPSRTRPEIDTQAIINQTPSSGGKIKTLRKQIWEMTGDGKRLPVQAHQEHILFEDCMYLCTHVFGSSSGKRVTEVYLWIGDGVSPSSVEDAQLFARNAAREAGGKLIVLTQGKESANFFEALGGIVITRKGSANSASATYMLCGRRHMGQIAFDETTLTADSLCSGFPFIVAASGGSLYLWKGRGSGADELGCARLIGMDLGLTGEIEEVEEGDEPVSFWSALKALDKKPIRDPGHWPLKASKESYGTRLYAIDDARPRSSGLGSIAQWARRQSQATIEEPGTAQIREISPFAQSDLAQDGVFVLDAYFEVYVILGWRASSRFAAFRSAILFAQEYAILAASQEDRPFVPTCLVVIAGTPGGHFKAAFRKWDGKRVTTKPVAREEESVVLALHEALAVVEGA